MKHLFCCFLAFVVRCLLSLRYSIKIKGFKDLSDRQGVLFLPNHPAEIDPVIVTTLIYSRFPIRPLMTEPMYNLPVLNTVMKWINTIPVPDMEQGFSPYKIRRMEKVLETTADGLEQGDNILLYPSGGLQRGGLEKLKGASAVANILEKHPDVPIVLIRTRGLWGSSFSVALTRGITPNVGSVLLNAAKVLLRNLIFLTPRREVNLEFVEAPETFPRNASKMEINSWLEEWYNQPGEEALSLKSYSFYKTDLPDVEAASQALEVDLSDVSMEIQNRVIAEFARMADRPPEEIEDSQLLTEDLGLDSLDLSEVLVWLDQEFDVQDVEITELVSVGKVMEIAAGRSGLQDGEIARAPENWIEANRPSVEKPTGQTLQEAFLRNACRMKNAVACADENSGVMTYKRVKIGALVLAQVISKMPGDKVGVMLPSTAGVGVVAFGCLLAGKTPVMINWTLGPRNLQHVIDLTGISQVITSSVFLDKLGNVELGPLDDLLVFVEDLRVNEIGLSQKIKAIWMSMFSADSLLQKLNLLNLNEHDPAVILFTSGSESVPKGVPLSHHNLLTNIKDGIQVIPFDKNDVLYGFLPPFHSFGFTITTMLPLTTGLKVAYYPNPTESRRLARGIHMWKCTTVCGTPSFVSGIFKAADPAQLTSVKYFVTGAEKAPDELFRKVEALGVGAKLIEGYGITECAPILTMNYPDRERCGVGWAAPSSEVKVVDIETMSILPDGERGLLIARGGNIFAGYLGDDAPDPFVTVEGKKWYNTGDLGVIQENGAVMLAGRLKRFVKVAGEMISLPAMEDVLMDHWPANEDGPVVAVEAVEREGVRPILAIFSCVESTLDEANEVLKEAGFSNVGRLNHYEKVNEIPLLGTGKTNHKALKAELAKKFLS